MANDGIRLLQLVEELNDAFDVFQTNLQLDEREEYAVVSACLFVTTLARKPGINVKPPCGNLNALMIRFQVVSLRSTQAYLLRKTPIPCFMMSP